MLWKTEPTYTVRVYMAGDIAHARQLLRREVYPPNAGLCVTVEPTTFVFTGGEEAGFVLGFVNYPRFPSEPRELWARAQGIAERLIPALGQWSALLVAQDKTAWLTARPEDQR